MFKILSIIALCGLMFGCVSNIPKMSADDINASYSTANKAYVDKKFKLALFEYLKLSESVRADAIIWFRIGNSYNHLENYDEAIKAYEKAVLLDPRLSKAWHNMGVIQLKQSVNTWRQMLIYMSKDDALYDRALSLTTKLLGVVDEK